MKTPAPAPIIDPAKVYEMPYNRHFTETTDTNGGVMICRALGDQRFEGNIQDLLGELNMPPIKI
jgi:hypothetical protein